jgi:lipopolysaccharide biosynthesis regulator YciM
VIDDAPLWVRHARPLLTAAVLLLAALLAALLVRVRRNRARRRHRAAPLDARESYLVGAMRLVDGDTEGAIAALTQAVQVSTDFLEPYFALGQLFRRTGDLERAIGIHRSLVLRPSLDPVAKTRALYELGQDYKRFGMLDRAAESLGQVIASEPDHVPALELLRDVHADAREWREAIAAQERVMRLTSRRRTGADGREAARTLAGLWASAGEDALRAGDTGTARQYLKRALKIDPRCGDGHRVLGDALTAAGRHRAAADTYAAALAATPERADELVPRLVAALEACERTERLPAVLRRVAVAVQDRGDDPSPVETALGRALAAAGDGEAAEEALRAVLRRTPTSVAARRALMGLLVERGRYTDVERQYLEVLDALDADGRAAERGVQETS